MNNKRRAEIFYLITQIESVKSTIEQIQGQFADIQSSLKDITDEEHEEFDCLPEKTQESERGCAVHDAAEKLNTALTNLNHVDRIALEATIDLNIIIDSLKAAKK